MTDLTMRGLGPFAPNLSPSQRGERAVRLTKACGVSRDARPVAIALGRCGDPEGLDEALRLFESLDARARKLVAEKYEKISKGRP